MNRSRKSQNQEYFNKLTNFEKHIFQRWYFGKYSRVASEMQLLFENNLNGTFLIRESESNGS